MSSLPQRKKLIIKEATNNTDKKKKSQTKKSKKDPKVKTKITAIGLQNWAKLNDYSYRHAWRMAKAGEIPNCFQDANSNWFVKMELIDKARSKSSVKSKFEKDKAKRLNIVLEALYDALATMDSNSKQFTSVIDSIIRCERFDKEDPPSIDGDILKKIEQSLKDTNEQFNSLMMKTWDVYEGEDGS